jgi:hypothetical protein
VHRRTCRTKGFISSHDDRHYCVPRADAGNPSLHQARVLRRRQRSIWAASTWKQNLPRLPTAAAQIRVERLARLLGQFEPHRPTGFPLAHVGTVGCVALRRHVIDAQCHEIASAQFAVDRQVEEGQVACTQLKVQLGPMDQTCPGRSGGLGPMILPLFHGDRE